MDKELYKNYLNTGQVSRVGSISKKTPYCEYLFDAFFNEVKKNELIVDLACGFGEMVYYLENKEFTNIIGIEISQELVELSKQLGVKNVFEGDIFDYLKTVQDESIKVVIMKDIIEHIEINDLGELMKLIKKKLCKNGFVIGHAPNGSGIFGMLIKYNDLTHKTAYTQKSLEQLGRICGYKNITVYEDKPLTKGIKGIFRKLAWVLFTAPFRLLYYVESGKKGIILSQNITFKIS
jgi:SAM-dependent methyltransferase